ncbi:hypothetical protein FKM82_017062 [Ascaphus truei]
MEFYIRSCIPPAVQSQHENQSPLSLSCFPAGATYIFGKSGGLILYTWPPNDRPSTRTDRLAVGFSTTVKDGILVRIDSTPGLMDFLQLHIPTDDLTVSSAECAMNPDDEDVADCENGTGGELVIPVLVEEPLDIPPIATRAPSITLPPTFQPLLTIIETTKDSLSVTPEAGLPCLSDQGSDGCDDDDDDDDDDDGLVISGYGSGETFDSNLPPTDDEDFYTTLSLVTDKSLSTSFFDGGFKSQAPKWGSKDFRPNKVSEPGRTSTTSLPPELVRSMSSSVMVPMVPAGKMNNHEHKPQPDIVLLPLPTAYDLDSTKRRSPLITTPMFRNVPTANPTMPGSRRVPGASEVVRESSSTTGMVVGIVAAAALCILILLYAMYKYRNRDEGSYQVDETRNYISNSAQSNGALVKEKQHSSKGGHKKHTNKDKEYYV